MARINLLPWRKEQRERRNKEFNALAAATAGVAALCVILALSFLNKELSNQQDANQRIKDANAQLDLALKSIEDLETKREQMLSQMKVIQDLQGRRSIPVRVWDDMARAVPEAMYLNNIKRDADVITLTGFADNPNVVAALVRNLNASEWLDGSAVVSIKSKLEAYQAATPQTNNNKEPTRPTYPEDNYVEFVVTTKVQNPQTEEEKAKAGTNGTEEVPLPPVTTDGGTAMPEVATIGVENAPQTANPQTPAPAPTPQANGTNGANQPAPAPQANGTASTNQPVAQSAPAQGATPQNAQPVATNSNTPAGGQK